MGRAEQLGRYAAVTQLVLAGVLGGFASLHAEPSLVPRGGVLFAIFALPAIVGWIGANRRRPALLGAAAVTSGIGAFIAFSGVTLVFLLSALMFLASALGLAVPAPGGRGGVVSGAGQLVVGAAICLLLVGSGASTLFITDSACWLAHQTPFGASIEVLPYSTGEMTLAGDVTSGGCSTGLFSLLGVSLATVLATVAIGLAILAGRRSDPSAVPPPPRPPSPGAAS